MLDRFHEGQTRDTLATAHGNDAAENLPVWESFQQLYDRFVDPRDALADVDGTLWSALGEGENQASRHAAPFCTEQELKDIRVGCRQLAVTNEFAINGHENRVNYIVGTGHTYRAMIKKGFSEDESLALETQLLLDQFITENDWHRRQQEIVLRKDRDGEVFLRFFPASDGVTRVRFVEPGQVFTPRELSSTPAATFGIVTDPHDVETVVTYFIDGEGVDAGEIQHRRANVDSNVKRGLPLFYPVRKNLSRAEKLLRNMSVLAEIQSSIALIRRHQGAGKTAMQQFVAGQADVQLTDPATGRTQTYKRFSPGTILDTQGNVAYDFPAANVNASAYVAVLQAELRAIASRLVMPEFMLTSDASNANYASTMVAEGPAVKAFQRLQARQVAEDLQVMWRAVSHGVASGRISPLALRAIEIQAAPPSLAVRDALGEAQVARIQLESGILSPQTWSQRAGLDYEQEQQNRRAHEARISSAKDI